MAYLVNLTARAERDLADLYDEINAGDSDAALRWYLRLVAAILSLEAQPNRCPVTPENSDLRRLLYGPGGSLTLLTSHSTVQITTHARRRPGHFL